MPAIQKKSARHDYLLYTIFWSGEGYGGVRVSARSSFLLPLYSKKLHILTRRASTSWVASLTILFFSFVGMVTNHFVKRTFPCRLTSSNQLIYGEKKKKSSGWKRAIFLSRGFLSIVAKECFSDLPPLCLVLCYTVDTELIGYGGEGEERKKLDRWTQGSLKFRSVIELGGVKIGYSSHCSRFWRCHASRYNR